MSFHINHHCKNPKERQWFSNLSPCNRIIFKYILHIRYGVWVVMHFFKVVIYYTFHAYPTDYAEFKMQWPEDKEVLLEECGHGLRNC